MSSLVNKRNTTGPLPRPKRLKQTHSSTQKQQVQIHPSLVNKTIINPTLWSCTRTGTTNDVWVCLGDGRVVSKGASNQGPATDHYTRTGYGLYMRLNRSDNPLSSKTFFSQQTQRYVVPRTSDPNVPHFKHFKTMLLKVRGTNKRQHRGRPTKSGRNDSDGGGGGGGSGMVTRSTLGYVTTEIIAGRQKQDRIATAVYAWKHLMVAKCFHSWSVHVNVVKQHKLYRAVDQKGNKTRMSSSTAASKIAFSSSEEEDNEEPPIVTTRPPYIRRQMSNQVLEILGGKTGTCGCFGCFCCCSWPQFLTAGDRPNFSFFLCVFDPLLFCQDFETWATRVI